MKGFRKFLMRGNLIDLAVAVVIGVAFNNIVQALISDFIGPLIGAIAGTGSQQTAKSGAAASTSATTTGSTSAGTSSVFQDRHFTLLHSQFMWGNFVDAVISFLVIAAVVYFLLVAPSQKLAALTARNQAATDRECPECLSKIPVAAKRCMYCTSVVPPVTAAEPTDSPLFPGLRLGRHRHAAPDAGPAPETP